MEILSKLWGVYDFEYLRYQRSCNIYLHTDVHYDANIEVTHSEICSAINDLENNKSCGLDGVNAEHLKHCTDRIVPMLAMCFTGLFIQGVLPPSMISVVLVPIVKNKRISICSKNNYRPIALASIMSKLLEKIICLGGIRDMQ